MAECNHTRMSRSDLARLAKAPESSKQVHRLVELQDLIAGLDDTTFEKFLDAGRRLVEEKRR